MTREQIRETILGLKVGDHIQINEWDKTFCVNGVSERFVLAHNGQEYTILGKKPVQYLRNGITPGALVCATDWWVFGYIDGYRFDNPKWVEGYMKSLESGETEMSARNREEILYIALRNDASR